MHGLEWDSSVPFTSRIRDIIKEFTPQKAPLRMFLCAYVTHSKCPRPVKYIKILDYERKSCRSKFKHY